MEFKKSQMIKLNNKFIIFGKIHDTFTIIFSEFEINTMNLNLTDEQFKNEHFWDLKVNDKVINIICQKDNNIFSNDTNKNNYIIVNETRDDYINHILPYINNIYTFNTKWIFNILEKKTEQDKILLNQDNFLIVKDINWNEVNEFYILAIPFEKLKTIRNLRKKHIPLLKSMKEKCIEVAKNFNIKENQLYFFFHYHPSFYQLHLHCTLINHPKLSSKYFRCKMLDIIIDNLENYSLYYRNKQINYEIPKYHPIVKILENK